MQTKVSLICLITFSFFISGCFLTKAEDERIIEAFLSSMKIVAENTGRIPDEDLKILRDGAGSWKKLVEMVDEFENYNRKFDEKLSKNKNYKPKPSGNKWDYVIKESSESDIKKLMHYVGENRFNREDLAMYDAFVTSKIDGQPQVLILQFVIGTNQHGNRVIKDMIGF